MDSLVIHAASRTSAEGFRDALFDLGATVVEANFGRYQVEIPLGGGDKQIVEALRRIEEYVIIRGDGPARLDLGGHRYTLHPTEAA